MPPVRDQQAATAALLRDAGCVFAEDEAGLLVDAARTPDELDALVQERVAGVPLEYLLGWAEFGGRRILVGRGVFVPRRRTQLLVDLAVRLAPAHPVVVELCCGTAAIARVLYERLALTEMHAADIDVRALTCARRNLAGTGAHVHCGDLYDALPASLASRIDLLVVNAPYVPRDEIPHMPREAREHEPAVAHDGGSDGLDVHRRLAQHAQEWLAGGGHVLVETSAHQAAATAQLFLEREMAVQVVGDEELDATAVVVTTQH